MELVLSIVCAAIVVGVGWYVARPLFAPPTPAPALPSTGTSVWQMHERKERLYTTIKELELDHSQEKLSDADYQHQRQSLEAEALGILEQLDQLNGGVENDDMLGQIETEIQSMRLGVCSECGLPRRTGDRFCPQCGSELQADSGSPSESDAASGPA